MAPFAVKAKRAATGVTLAETLETLRACQAELEARGVLHAGVFGSVARGEVGRSSDIDIYVELDESRHLSVYDFVGIRQFLEAALSGRVDLVEREAMKPRVRENARIDSVDAF
ncbi:MAG: nucleotidyltransferase domain-containing protein [Rhodospirillaceae bacterium]|nr:nucleotidyltransferase domain-containing protein [Rhodospirillaceae bacterium]